MVWSVFQELLFCLPLVVFSGSHILFSRGATVFADVVFVARVFTSIRFNACRNRPEFERITTQNRIMTVWAFIGAVQRNARVSDVRMPQKASYVGFLQLLPSFFL